MELNVSRFFNDRLVFDPTIPDKLRVTSSLWDWCKRIVSWIYGLKSYSDENRRTIACFKKYVSDLLGAPRLQRICTKYSLDLDQLERSGSPLVSRDVAKIVIGSQDVTVQDIEDFQQLNCSQLAGKVNKLASILKWEVPEITRPISGSPTEWISSVFHDRFLSDRERMQLCKKHGKDTHLIFVHNLLARVIKREMDVGTMIPAPHSQFYYVAAKVITGEGMVSYVLQPATSDTKLEPMRVFRGTAPRSADIDALSTVITDLELDLGKSAYKSGFPYEDVLENRLGKPSVEAGHSLGSTIVQYRLANMDHIEKAYLFCGPGLPEKEMKKFNQKMTLKGAKPAHLTIRHSARDLVSRTGQFHLGYGSFLEIDYCKNYPPLKGHGNPHVYVYGKGRVSHGIEGGFNPKRRDLDFCNKDSGFEWARSIFGPPIALALRGVRAVSRTIVTSRADLEKGVQIGSFHEGRFQVEHFR